MPPPAFDTRDGLTRCLTAGAIVTVATFLGLGSSLVLADPNCGGSTDSWRCGAPGYGAGAGVALAVIGLTAVALRACRVPRPVPVSALSLLTVLGLLVSAGGALPGLPVLPLLVGAGWAWALRPERHRTTPWIAALAVVSLTGAGLVLGP